MVARDGCRYCRPTSRRPRRKVAITHEQWFVELMEVLRKRVGSSSAHTFTKAARGHGIIPEWNEEGVEVAPVSEVEDSQVVGTRYVRWPWPSAAPPFPPPPEAPKEKRAAVQRSCIMQRRSAPLLDPQTTFPVQHRRSARIVQAWCQCAQRRDAHFWFNTGLSPAEIYCTGHAGNAHCQGSSNRVGVAPDFAPVLGDPPVDLRLLPW